ncbi:hypothetical protein K435DRAFT_800101 [Dendrothele bispora CBS 962.96]|uniref:Peptidase A1 domain-containing protein n=1 Tax=Dendrothele bispora (strain CBS 962.96) TaxID=1314807 RepID=A0A4S8LTP7_DENBC|nr:hypothetical protein K435DRAFT_800101 [Dendrothele bispora CBS 962.96]
MVHSFFMVLLVQVSAPYTPLLLTVLPEQTTQFNVPSATTLPPDFEGSPSVTINPYTSTVTGTLIFNGNSWHFETSDDSPVHFNEDWLTVGGLAEVCFGEEEKDECADFKISDKIDVIGGSSDVNCLLFLLLKKYLATSGFVISPQWFQTAIYGWSICISTKGVLQSHPTQ